MKRSYLQILTVSGAIIVAGALLLRGGSLTPPPGPVSSTHKTLTEIVPGIAINAANTPGDNDAPPSLFTITQPGSYYLTGKITGVSGKVGIKITASDVTLDLSGFELIGVPGSFSGIYAFATGGLSATAVRNGTVRAWGSRAVDLASGTACVVDGVRAIVNSDGIFVGVNSIVSRCTAESNGGTGISVGAGCTVTGCTAQSNFGLQAIDASFGSTVTNCTAISNTGDGIRSSGAVTGCSSTSNGDDGIVALSRSRVERCTCNLNTGDGIEAASNCLILKNTCDGNGFGAGDGAGIHIAIGDDTRIEGNSVTDNDRGIDVDFVGNLIIRNSASGNNGLNYQIVAGNVVGPTVTFSNIATRDNPHANYDF